MKTACRVGFWLLIAGAGLSVAEGIASNDASSTGIPYEQTGVGKIESYIPNPTPYELGTVLLIAGATLYWILPFAYKR